MEEDYKIPLVKKEIDMWRNRFLKDKNVPNRVALYFLSCPFDSFMKKTPEENLQECMDAYIHLNPKD